jgi:hypothetical protein
LRGDMRGRGHQLIEHPRVGGRTVGGDLDGGRSVFKCSGEELPGGRISRFSEDQHVDNLAELVDCPVQADPSSSDFHLCFVDKPSVLDQSSIVTLASPPTP